MEHDFRVKRSNFVCFSCRKMFRKTLLRQSYGGVAEGMETALCPECHQPLKNIGRCFEPPRRQNIKKWKVAATLYLRGFRWFSSSHDGDCLGPDAHTMREAKALIQAVQKRQEEMPLRRANEKKREAHYGKKAARFARRFQNG